MSLAFLGVGSNLGDREKNLKFAQQKLGALKGIQLLRASKIYETDPVGGPPQGKYLNAVWEIETSLAPLDLLRNLLEIEKKMGRVRVKKNAPRPLDLDLLFYDNRVIHVPGLRVPHPRLHEREFVLRPFCDLAPDFVHPGLGKTIAAILNKTFPSPRPKGRRKQGKYEKHSSA